MNFLIAKEEKKIHSHQQSSNANKCEKNFLSFFFYGVEKFLLEKFLQLSILKKIRKKFHLFFLHFFFNIYKNYLYNIKKIFVIVRDVEELTTFCYINDRKTIDIIRTVKLRVSSFE